MVAYLGNIHIEVGLGVGDGAVFHIYELAEVAGRKLAVTIAQVLRYEEIGEDALRRVLPLVVILLLQTQHAWHVASVRFRRLCIRTRQEGRNLRAPSHAVWVGVFLRENPRAPNGQATPDVCRDAPTACANLPDR